MKRKTLELLKPERAERSSDTYDDHFIGLSSQKLRAKLHATPTSCFKLPLRKQEITDRAIEEKGLTIKRER